MIPKVALQMLFELLEMPATKAGCKLGRMIRWVKDMDIQALTDELI